MGVKGLWRLLLPIGRRISIETLEGKTLAIDASIWLTQFLKAMRDPDTGSVRPAAHLIGFFRRLCKLRYHGIRPVLVFDGATPEIKLRELQRRRKRREHLFAANEANTVQRMAKRILAAELKKKAENQDGAHAPGFRLAEDEKTDQHGETPSETQNGEAVETPPIEQPNDSQKQNTKNYVDLVDQTNEWENAGHVDNDWFKAGEQTQSTESGQSSGSDDDPSNEYELDVDEFASLPSHSRKDAIEDAKRRQRMRSRREFMPVAALPVQYSQVQLRNFLRSSRLNRQIHDMATEVSKKNDGEQGERVVSDSTRRIIFTKYDQPTGSKHETATRQLVTRVETRESSDEEEYEWQDEESVEATVRNNSKEESRPQEPANVTLVEGGQANQSDEGAKAGGGFLVETIEDYTAKSENANQTEEISGGGFVVENGAKNESEIGSREVGACNFGRKRRLDDLLESSKVDPGDADQELNDELLARGIYDSELAGVSIDAHVASDMANSQIVTEGGTNLAASSTPVEFQQASTDNEDDSDDDVEWEEGDACTEKCENLPQARSPGGVPEPCRATEENADVSRRLPGDQSISIERTVDTEVSTTNVPPEKVKRFNNVSSHVSLSLDKKLRSDEGLYRDEGENAFRSDFDRPQNVDANAEALEQAQATASNLTDWAGRAFRRAIAKHAHPSSSSRKLQRPAGSAELDKIEEKDIGRKAFNQREHVISQTPADGIRNTVPAPALNTSPALDTLRDNVQTPISSFENPIAALNEEELHLNEVSKRHERDMDTITDEMKAEVITLIRLFGIPYVESPAEAEAQCAALEKLGLVDGIVTEDSDVFVFGGRNIYKNIFDDQKYVEAYLSADAERDLALSRNEMVALAMLLGGDYTEGVRGVGIVNGMEILQAFDVSNGVKEGLSKFRGWLEGFDPNEALGLASEDVGLSPVEIEFRSKHKSARGRWTAPPDFPADNVLNAYLNPVVDNSSERFSWGVPDIGKLAVFCQRNMGWDSSETEKLVMPVIQKIESGSRQTRIESFFMTYEDNIKFAKVQSKRLRDVFHFIQNSSKDSESDTNK